MFMCTADAPDMPAPDAAMVCIISAASVMPRPAPPYCLGHRDAEPAVARERLVKIGGKAAVGVLAQPVIGIEAGAEFFDRARIASWSSVKEKSMAVFRLRSG